MPHHSSTLTSRLPASSRTGSTPTTDASRPTPWTGLRVAVTGGTSGLGLALVEALHDRGARIAFVARRADRVQALAERLPRAHGIVGDVSRKDLAHPIALQILAALDGLDVLIHNASALGPVPLAPLADTECEELEEALGTNLVGPFRLTRALLGSLDASARAGRPAAVLHVTSDAAVTPYPTWGAYGASKAALRHLSRIWDLELRDRGIRVLDADPGDMDTPLHAAAVPDADRSALKRPGAAADELLARLETEVLAATVPAGASR